MELNIDLDNNEDITEFCNWIISKMPDYLIDEIDENKLFSFDSYLNESNAIKWVSDEFKKVVSTKDLLIAASLNMQLLKNGNHYTIKINPDITIPDTYAKFIDIVRLVNYGNLGLFAYPIYDKMMQFFADNLPNLYQLYLGEN